MCGYSVGVQKRKRERFLKSELRSDVVHIVHTNKCEFPHSFVFDPKLVALVYLFLNNSVYT